MSAPSDSGVVPEWWTTHGRNPDRVLPGGVFNANGPNGEPVPTPTDHRMLWWVRDGLLGAASTLYLRNLFGLLNDYLGANCQHYWQYYAGDDVYPAHRQCVWCHGVEEPN